MKDEILNKITQEQIYQYYFPEEIDMRTHYVNPTRLDDTRPGCTFKYLGDTLMFVDFANNPTHMDCFKFIQKYYNLNFYDVLVQISKDFNLHVHKPETLFENNELDPLLIPRKEIILEKVNKIDTIIKVITQAFNVNDLEYWEQFGITLGTLQLYDVKSCYEAWINGFKYHRYKDSDPMYRYREKDKFKIYRPFANKRYKWRTNMAGGLLEGWDQLPKTGNIVFVTKSRKDVMTLYEAGHAAVSVRAESSIVSENAANLLNERFEKIYSWFDNDDAGIMYSKKQSLKYNWESVQIPIHFPKDPSDFVKKYSIKELNNLINNVILKK